MQRRVDLATDLSERESIINPLTHTLTDHTYLSRYVEVLHGFLHLVRCLTYNVGLRPSQRRVNVTAIKSTMADRRLREQLTASEEERREAEVTAIQRLDDIIQLKTQLEDANLVITDLKVGFSDNYQVIKVIKHESLVSISSQSVSLADYSVLHVGISQDQCLVQILPSGHVSSTG